MIKANLGFPRIGAKRELKFALEAFWRNEISGDELERIGCNIRRKNWELQTLLGIDHIPSNDFSYYDHVLDTIAMVGAVPARYSWDGENIDLKTYFAMARGQAEEGKASAAMEMTKWFDTNYHYIVPEFEKNQTFKLCSLKVINEFAEAKAMGIHTRPVLLGPVSFLLLGKMQDENQARFDLLPGLLAVYKEVLACLNEAGAEWIQLDEPCLVLDCDQEIKAAYQTACYELSSVSDKLKILLCTYFGDLKENIHWAANLPVAGIHLDLERAPAQLDNALEIMPEEKVISLGLIDGRNVWRSNLEEKYQLALKALTKKKQVIIAPSCSLLHVPLDLDAETDMDATLKNWLAFAKQKLQELMLLGNALEQGKTKAFAVHQEKFLSRQKSNRVHLEKVKAKAAAVTDDMLKRKDPFAVRKSIQQQKLGLPIFPTTTIGSFPQTKAVRLNRAAFKKGEKNQEQYDEFVKSEIKKLIEFQEMVELDVMVHGEFERNDMVEFFGEKLEGFVLTRNGWVQSYGSRCVKPPIIFGDVYRPQPMTVGWSQFAQSLTKKPMKGMLTGPVTILQWSFVRDDQPRAETCKQIALAIRDEVLDLEQAGIKIIQIDEPALREGLPLRKTERKDYLKWAVDCFRLSASGVKSETQIHTHMCYGEFKDILAAVVAMDADVISMEASRSKMELLEDFNTFDYPNDIGPGVYDVHSPRIPPTEEMVALLQKASKVIPAERIWVNPDCGLKTRGWKEVKDSLNNMVQAAKRMRALWKHK